MSRLCMTCAITPLVCPDAVVPLLNDKEQRTIVHTFNNFLNSPPSLEKADNNLALQLLFGISSLVHSSIHQPAVDAILVSDLAVRFSVWLKYQANISCAS